MVTSVQVEVIATAVSFKLHCLLLIKEVFDRSITCCGAQLQYPYIVISYDASDNHVQEV